MNYLLKFLHKNWISIALITVLATIVRQSLFVNDFPFSLQKKQTTINKIIRQNQLLQQQNQVNELKLQDNLDADMEILESQARYKFGLVKKNERYYQVSE